jgi:hypothetical protein
VWKEIIKTYLDFDRNYLICPEEFFAIYGLVEDVDNHIDDKLKRFPLNKLQRLKVKETRDQFLGINLQRVENSFKSKDLLKQYVIPTEKILRFLHGIKSDNKGILS